MDRAVDILHPLSSLELRQCRGPPVSVGGARGHAVWLKDKVYAGGTSSGSTRADAKIYIYSPATDTWTTLDTPVYWFVLTTYHSQLVLVGGMEYVDEKIRAGDITNKLWTLSEDGQWQETLPPTPTPCGIFASAVSHGDHLLVIGGDKVYVYNGHHWASAQHPPQKLYFTNSTVYNGHWYLIGPEHYFSLPTYVYSCSLDSLLASCQPSETSQPSSVWKRLTDVPNRHCYPAVFGNRLVAVGDGSPPTTTSLHAYSSLTQSWVHVGDAPYSSTGAFPCAVVLPSNELMVVRGQTTFKGTLKSTPFNGESSFSLRAVSLLEPAAGIPVMTTLTDFTQHIQIFLGLPQDTTLDLNGLLNYWISSVQWLPPSWRNLLLIIRLLNLDELAQRMETYLSAGATEELSPTRGKQGDEQVDEQIRLRDDVIFQLKQQITTKQQQISDFGYRIEALEYRIEALEGQPSQTPVKAEEGDEVDEQIRLRDDVIFQLKQQIATQQERITDLEYEFKGQSSQTSIKKEDDDEVEAKPHVHVEKPIIPIKVKTEFKEEEPISLLPVKREVKEEAVPVTKAETTSAQPTIATWNLRGVEVCGEMTVVVYSSHDQQITWPGYGLRLNIPKGCLPAGMEQCTINIKASLAGQYEFPENSHPVSAIIWLRCEDVHKFARPITVEIQHCAKSENVTNLKLSFVRAVCSQKQLPYTFKQLVGGNFTSHSSYGVIELNNFSGVGVTQEGSEDREYCSQLFYLGQPNLCQIHFVVIWNVEAHLTAVKEEYKTGKVLLGPRQPVEFDSDTISLDIPMDGLSIKGWKITPLMRPVVTKKQVDNFGEGKLTPCCQLKAEVSARRKKLLTLKHQVTLQGAKYPHNVFTIDLPAEDPNSQPAQTFGDLAAAEHQGPPPKKRSRLEYTESSTFDASTGPSSSMSGLDTNLDLSDHYKVVCYLRKLDNHQIRYVGGALGLAYNTLDKMKDVPSEMVAAWLRREDYVMAASGEPTWRTLVNALRKEGQEGTARGIEEKER